MMRMKTIMKKEENSMNIGENNKQNENMDNMSIEQHHQQQVTQDVSVLTDPKSVKDTKTLEKVKEVTKNKKGRRIIS